MKLLKIVAMSTAALLTVNASSATAEGTIAVTLENYNQAEAARNFNNWAKLGGDNKLIHLKELSPVGDEAPTVRMNRDTLYSVGVFKNSGKLTVTLPESDQFQSVMAIDDHSFNPLSVNGAGTYPIVSDSDYVFITVRTYVADQDDRSAYDYAYQKQAGIVMSGVDTSSPYTAPDYNQAQLEELTLELIDQLTATGKPYFFLTGKDKVTSPEIALYNTQSKASGWAGTVVDYSGESAFYKSSQLLSASSCMVINSPAPNDKYFTSLTFYDQAGYMVRLI